MCDLCSDGDEDDAAAGAVLGMVSLSTLVLRLNSLEALRDVLERELLSFIAQEDQTSAHSVRQAITEGTSIAEV